MHFNYPLYTVISTYFRYFHLFPLFPPISVISTYFRYFHLFPLFPPISVISTYFSYFHLFPLVPPISVIFTIFVISTYFIPNLSIKSPYFFYSNNYIFKSLIIWNHFHILSIPVWERSNNYILFRLCDECILTKLLKYLTMDLI